MSEWTFVWSTSRPSVPLGPSLSGGLSNSQHTMLDEVGGRWKLLAPGNRTSDLVLLIGTQFTGLHLSETSVHSSLSGESTNVCSDCAALEHPVSAFNILISCFLQTPVEDVPLAIAPFQGRVLVGVGKLLRIYDMGKKKLLRKCENKVARL